MNPKSVHVCRKAVFQISIPSRNASMSAVLKPGAEADANRGIRGSSLFR